MPCVVSFRAINVNSPQQNSGVFIGEVNITGWDANVKANAAHASVYGFSNLEAATINATMDGQEFLDGTMNDWDYKPTWGFNL